MALLEAYRNSVSFLVHGRTALFSDPVTRAGGEKCSYQVPTYQALKGVLESVYWKPTFIWVVDAVRVMQPIRTRSRGIRPIKMSGGNDLAMYTYLEAVAYQVQAHFVWNEQRGELAFDRNEHKHHNIAKRMIQKGGRRDVFLGARECQAYVEPCDFGEGSGVYDAIPEMAFGLMFHGFTYPDESEDRKMVARFWSPVMRKGIIEFIAPQACPVQREIKSYAAKQFVQGENFTSIVQSGEVEP